MWGMAREPHSCIKTCCPACSALAGLKLHTSCSTAALRDTVTGMREPVEIIIPQTALHLPEGEWRHWRASRLFRPLLHLCHGSQRFDVAGSLQQKVVCRGKMYALNAPLESGITDEAYKRLFQPVMRKAVEVFQPEAIVFQSGMPARSALAVATPLFLAFAEPACRFC